LSHNAFVALGVPANLAETLARGGIDTPTPIQAATLPDSLGGRDLLGRGRTGSGKTYAFLLPILARLAPAGQGPRAARTPRSPRALVIVPTRELAIQIDTALALLAKAAGLTSLTVFGGVGQSPQVRALRAGVDIVIACPGRLEDLIGQGECRLDRVEITVLDEADHMSDLGFLPAVRRLLELTATSGQRLLFSATLDAAVAVIVKRYLRNPVTHEADSPMAATADVEHHVLQVDAAQRMPVLVDLTSGSRRSVVFTRTKHRAKTLARKLNAEGVSSVELHGNLAQNARTRNLAAFHSGAASTLVATDIAARGIHVDDVELVIHADPPSEFKAYVHRSGRTARAGAKGTVITLMEREQAAEVRALVRAAGIRPTTTSVGVGHPLLRDLVPGERTLVPVAERGPVESEQSARTRPGSGAASSSRNGRSAAPATGQRRGGPAGGPAGGQRRGAPTTAQRSSAAPVDGQRGSGGSAAGRRPGAPAAVGQRTGAVRAGTFSAARMSEGAGGRRRRSGSR